MASKIETYELDASNLGEVRDVVNALRDLPDEAIVRIKGGFADMLNPHGVQIRTLTVEHRPGS